MNLFTIAFRNILQRRLPSLLTGLSVALGVMLMVMVLTMHSAVESAFNQRSIAYDLIIGPKGSDLQLVLSSVFRIQPPIENLPYSYYEQIREDKRIVSAVPLAFGDTTEQGAFPIVGTTEEYFRNEYAPGRAFQVRGEDRMDDMLDSLVGAEVARRNGWDVGDQFTIIHGGADSTDKHEELFTVVGVLAPTGTPNDRTVFVNLEGFYRLDGHAKPVDEVERRLREFYAADEQQLEASLGEIVEYRKLLESAPGQAVERMPPAMKEVTAIFIRTRAAAADGTNAFDSVNLQAELKKGFQAMAVSPVRPIKRLLDNFVGPIQSALVVLTSMIIFVSGISIFVSIYNSMSDRRREIAIMRALGARRQTVFAIVLVEAAVLCVGGGVVGWLTGHGINLAAAPAVSTRTGLLLDAWAVNPLEWVIFPVMLLLGVLVGFLPALSAYRTDVADALAG